MNGDGGSRAPGRRGFELGLRSAGLLAAGLAGWIVFTYLTAFALTVGWRLTTGGVHQVDWHVYVAGARALLTGQLYGRPLALEGLVLSTTQYNLPPLSAVWAMPLLPLPIGVGGTIWQILGAASVASSAVIAASLARLRRPLLWAGVALGLVAPTLLYLEGLHLATDNYLMLALVAAFCWLHSRGHPRSAGAVLGVAIASKGWPIALLPVLLRERRWRTVAWSAVVVALQAVVFLAWLGPSLPAEIITAMGVHIPPTGLLIGPSALTWFRPAWNSGVSLAVAALLVLIPARGRTGLGLGILAGLAPIANLWIHYAPTVLFGGALLIAGLWDRWRSRPNQHPRAA